VDENVDANRAKSRRDFLSIAVGAAVAPMLAGGQRAEAASGQRAPALVKAAGRKGKPNILFIFTDQERYTSQWPKGLSLPAHERLQRAGVTFHNHYCPATMCTSSRSVLMTGLQTPDSGMFENTDVPWIRSLETGIPTIGHMLRKAGYYTAYKGKWHLNKTIDSEKPKRLFTEEMEAYGFSDFNGVGDLIGHTLGGYEFDQLISGSAGTWLRRHGRQLTDEGKPWCLFVSLVNPHDVMYFNTDLPGQKVQDTGRLIMHAAPAPNHAFYRATWDVPLPASLTQPFDEPGRPPAHHEFHEMWKYVLGEIPPEADRWRRFNDFYINCQRAVDNEVTRILGEIDALGLSDNTIIMFTSDHGEMAGAHGLHGKGPYAYQETMHLPFLLVHPDVRGGQDCQALTGHIDFVPTLLAMAGIGPELAGDIAGRNLPGRDITPVLTNPGAVDMHAVRESVLFTYSGLATNDSDLWRMVDDAKAAGKNPAVQIAKQGFIPNMKKRGSVRTVFDGRYKFSRYFSPRQRNRPGTLNELYQWNDVELFDLATDPGEMTNLAADRAANEELIQAMSNKLEAVIKDEIGVDDAREMPDIPLIKWTITRVDL
jgi:arylsulfatase A-like enzyme